jgi:hypothetical protein
MELDRAVGRRHRAAWLSARRPRFLSRKESHRASATSAAADSDDAAAANNQAGLYPDDVETIPMQITKEDLDRGQERYDIYCSVCTARRATVTAWWRGAASINRRRQIITRIVCARRRRAISST